MAGLVWGLLQLVWGAVGWVAGFPCSELLFHGFAPFSVFFGLVMLVNGFLTVFGLFLLSFGRSVLRIAVSPFCGVFGLFLVVLP